MKLFLMILLFSSSAFAIENWFPIGKEGAKTVWTKKAKCEQVEGQTCYDISKKDPRWHDVVTEQVDDLSKPIYKPKYNLKACDSPQHCAEEMGAEASDYCQNGDTLGVEKNKIMPGYSYFCYGITGYDQKEQTILVENSTKKATVAAEEAQKATQEAQLGAIMKDAKFGQKMIAVVGLRVRAKNLNLGQTKQVLSDYEAVIELLRAGSIPHAKAEVESMTPDGTRITQADKDALIAEINSYLGN